MSKKLAIEEVKERLFKVHGDTVILDESTYINLKKKCKFIDQKYGEWWTKPIYVLGGCKHKKRAFRKISDVCIFETCNNLNIDVLDSFYQKSSLRIKCKCKKCQYVWEAYFHNIKRGNSCRICSLQKRKKTYKKIYGVDHPSKSEIIKQKRKKTNLKKYGFENVMQNHKVAKKNAKSQSNSIVLRHWKTDEELICVGSYEKEVIKWLNKNKINYIWQHKTFLMPNGKTYRPDLYLLDLQKWIEIKGIFRNNAQKKWDWFKTQHPTAELWNEKKLKEMNIL